MWSMLKDGGGLAMLSAFVGVIATLVGIAAASMLGISRRTAFTVGLVALGLAGCSSSLGGVGVATGRSRTDDALSGTSVDPEMAHRIQEEGYSESAASGRVGAMFGALPFVLGAAAAFVGAGAPEAGGPGAPLPAPGPEPGPGIYANVPGAFAPAPKRGRGRFLVAGLFAALAFFALLGSLAAGLTAPYPNPNMYDKY